MQGQEYTRELERTINADVQRAFALADDGHKGYVDRDDLVVASIYLLGYKPTDAECNAMFERAQRRSVSVIPTGAQHSSDRAPYAESSTEEPRLNIEQFQSLFQPRLLKRDRLTHLQSMFRAFDTDDSGYITYEALKSAFTLVAPHVNEMLVRQCYDEAVSISTNGRIGWREFQAMMQSVT